MNCIMSDARLSVGYTNGNISLNILNFQGLNLVVNDLSVRVDYPSVFSNLMNLSFKCYFFVDRF